MTPKRQAGFKKQLSKVMLGPKIISGTCMRKGLACLKITQRPSNGIHKAAEQGLAEAQNNLAGIYDQGLLAPRDYSKAAELYRKAAEKGLATAQNSLGVMYQVGEGVSRDYAEAVKWYLKAAEQGLADAQDNLAGMYYGGLGVPQNSSEAAKWYRNAAKQGHANAEQPGCDVRRGTWSSSEIFRGGEMVHKAAKSGVHEAQDNLAGLCKEVAVGC